MGLKLLRTWADGLVAGKFNDDAKAQARDLLGSEFDYVAAYTLEGLIRGAGGLCREPVQTEVVAGWQGEALVVGAMARGSQDNPEAEKFGDMLQLVKEVRGQSWRIVRCRGPANLEAFAAAVDAPFLAATTTETTYMIFRVVDRYSRKFLEVPHHVTEHLTFKGANNMGCMLVTAYKTLMMEAACVGMPLTPEPKCMAFFVPVCCLHAKLAGCIDLQW